MKFGHSWAVPRDAECPVDKRKSMEEKIGAFIREDAGKLIYKEITELLSK